MSNFFQTVLSMICLCTLQACQNSSSHDSPSLKPSDKQQFNLLIIEQRKGDLGFGLRHFQVTDSTVRIYHTLPFIVVGSNVDTTFVFEGKHDKGKYFKQFLSQLNITDWQDLYINDSIMVTSGRHFILELETDSVSKKIWFSNFYFPPFKDLLNEVNDFAPDSLKIEVTRF